MRIVLVLWLAVLACSTARPPAPAPTSFEVRVDRRVELMTVLMRLAGAPEYQQGPTTTYRSAVATHFASFRDHAAVIATRELRAHHSISYDAPMWLAVALDDQLTLREPPGDPRWASVDVEAYLTSVRAFASDSGLDVFLARHRAHFAKVEERLRTAIAAQDPVAWFDGFFGARPGARFVVVPGMQNGPRNFGPHTRDTLYQIVGVETVDFDDLPVVGAPTLALVVHEMAHSYINPLLARHRAVLEPHATRLFAQVADAMARQAYPRWDIFLNEQLVRAVVVRFVRDRLGAEAADAELTLQERLSFRWTRPLVDLLSRYVADRQRSPDLDAFMPQIVELLANAR